MGDIKQMNYVVTKISDGKESLEYKRGVYAGSCHCLKSRCMDSPTAVTISVLVLFF